MCCVPRKKWSPKSFWASLLVVGVVASVPGVPRSIRADDLVQRELTPLIQSTAVMMAVVEDVASVTSLGYLEDGHGLFGGALRTGESNRLRLTLVGNREYAFIAGGDFSARDVDIEVRDDSGESIARDKRIDAAAVVRFVAPRTGRYRVTVKMFRSQGPSFCTLALLEEGGWRAAPALLVDALTYFTQSAALAAGAADGDVTLVNHALGWSYFGGIYRPGQMMTLSGNKPGSGRQLVLAAGDRNVRTIDLDVRDSSGHVGTTGSPNAYPVLAFPASDGTSYSVETQVHGVRPAFVLTGILKVKTRSHDDFLTMR